MLLGILVVLLGGADGNLNVSSTGPPRIIYYLVQGLIVPVACWRASRRSWYHYPALSSGGVRPRGDARAWWTSPASLTGHATALVAIVRGSGGADLHRQPRHRPGEGAGDPVGDPGSSCVVLGALTLLLHASTSRLPWAASCRSGAPGRRQPKRDPDLVVRVVLGDRGPWRHPARVLLLRQSAAPTGRPRSARPVRGRRSRHRRGQPFRWPRPRRSTASSAAC